jgi:integrase
MRGHIRERSPGHWAIVIDVREPQTGKRKRRWHSFAGTKRQAQVECARLLTEMKNGTSVDPSRMTVAAFLERWIEHMAGQVSPRSHERYAELCRKNLAPLLGALTLTKLQPAHISAAYAKALASGRRDGCGGLSARTVTHMHRVLREALQQAVRWQMLARNPADAVKPPKVERQQMRVLDADGAIDLIEAARGGTSLFVPILLGVRCGMRRGEVVALRWRNVDLDRGQVSVVASAEQTDQGVREKETKSGRGRTIVLSASEVEDLRAHRRKQAEGLLALGVRLTDDHHVVAREDGQSLQPRSLTHAFVKFARRHGVQIRLHDLRHSHATHMLAAGVHPKIAQERLGHSSVGITLDLYSHVLPGMQAEAVTKVDAMLRDALDRRAAKKKW